MLELPRGMKDFDEKEFATIEFIREKFLSLARLFSFSVMEPSPIELLETVEAKSGSAIQDEIYFFKDKGGRDIALRFDFTVGLTRYITSKRSIRMPAKVGSFGGVFRYDEPQKGRYRYFHQWNVEIYGKENIELEAEIIEFTSRFFDSIGLKNTIIEINHRRLVESYISKIFDSTDSAVITDILRAIDKITKKSESEILEEYCEKGYDRQKLEQIIKFSSIKGNIQEIEQKFDVTILDEWNHLVDLFESLTNRGVKNARINFSIVRGLDYYSGTVFEVFDAKSSFGALAGGGRYDKLTKAFGREDFSAVGVAGGVERIILTMEEQNLLHIPSKQKIAVLYVNKDLQKLAVSIASLLRLDGIITTVDLTGRQLKKQMESAADSEYTIILGPKELEENKAVLKNMITGTETKISLEELLNDPQSIFNLKKP